LLLLLFLLLLLLLLQAWLTTGGAGGMQRAKHTSGIQPVLVFMIVWNQNICG